MISLALLGGVERPVAPLARNARRRSTASVPASDQRAPGAAGATAAALFAGMGGRLDGAAARELVYTVPVGKGFAAIERAANAIVERHPDAEWVHGNVYDPVDGVTPLRWWEPGA